MYKSFLGFLVKPSSNVDALKNISSGVKIGAIVILVILSYLATAFTNPLGITNGYLSLAITTILSVIIIASLIFVLGKILFKGKASFLDILFFFVTSGLIYTVGTVVTNIIAVKFLGVFGIYAIYIFLLWYLVLLSKSLAKVNQITEGKVTVIVIGAVLITYFANGYIAPIIGINIF